MVQHGIDFLTDWSWFTELLICSELTDVLSGRYLGLNECRIMVELR